MSDFIYNQHHIPKKQWRYGLRSSAATGCGWIATYNALHLLGYAAKPEKLIQYYERQFPLINGNFGTFLFGPAIFFWQKHFKVKITFKRKCFDETIRKHEASIVFYYWRKKFRLGAHFVTVCYKDGKFVGYNTFRSSNGPDCYGNSMEAFLRQQKYFLPVLMAIRDESAGKEKLNRFGHSV